MPTIKETTVYSFDELSDRAKERARDWYREAMSEDFNDTSADCVIEDAARMADLMGINMRTRTVRTMGGSTRQEPQVYWSGFSSQGDGACFVGDYHYRKGSAKAIAAEAPAAACDQNKELNRIACELSDLQRRHFYRISADVSHSGRYSHEHSTDISVYIDGNDADSDLQEAITELLRDFMRWIYRQLEREWDYQNSDAAVDDSITANDYTFDEDGRRA